MTFKKFLETLIEDKLPIDKVKEDFIFYKNALNLKGKEDILFNNLFDNIFWILKNKFASFNCLYKDNEVMYSELTTILYSQIPQFLFLQKKQLLESLDTFGDINNWGSTMKEKVKRDLKLIETTDNSTGYIPIDSENLDPYSKDNTNRENTKDETTTDDRNTVDFLYFFSRMKWNTASIELTTILKPYYTLFLAFDVRDNDIDYSLNRYEELEERVGENELDIKKLKFADENIAKEIDRIDNTQTQDFIFLSNRIDDNKSKIEDNTSNINQITNELNETKQTVNRNTSNITINTNNINNINEKLSSSNFVDFKGRYDTNTTYKLNDSVIFEIENITYWFISLKNNNLNHTPQLTTNEWWLNVNEPNVNVANYYQKGEVDTLLLEKANLLSDNRFTGQNFFNSYVGLNGQIDVRGTQILYQSPKIMYSTFNNDSPVSKKYVDDLKIKSIQQNGNFVYNKTSNKSKWMRLFSFPGLNNKKILSTVIEIKSSYGLEGTTWNNRFYWLVDEDGVTTSSWDMQFSLQRKAATDWPKLHMITSFDSDTIFEIKITIYYVE